MSKTVNVNLSVDLDKPEEVKSLIKAFSAFLPEGEAVVEQPKAQPVRRQRRTKAQIEADKKAAEEAKSEQEEATDVKPPVQEKTETPTEPAEPETPAEEKPEEDSNEKAPTIADIRALVPIKAKNHRAELKAKLTELGTNNVTNLDPSKYSEFYAYLNSL